MLNSSDLSLLCKNCNPLKDVTPLFPSKPSLKIEILSSLPPTLFKNLVRDSTSHYARCTLGKAITLVKFIIWNLVEACHSKIFVLVLIVFCWNGKKTRILQEQLLYNFQVQRQHALKQTPSHFKTNWNSLARDCKIINNKKYIYTYLSYKVFQVLNILLIKCLKISYKMFKTIYLAS